MRQAALVPWACLNPTKLTIKSHHPRRLGQEKGRKSGDSKSPHFAGVMESSTPSEKYCQQVKHRVTMWPTTSYLGTRLKVLKTWPMTNWFTDVQRNVFITAAR